MNIYPVPIDIAARELQLHADNTPSLYKMRMAIAKSLATKKAHGQYDREKALAAWEYLAKAAAQSYQKEYADKTIKWNVAFNKESRNDFNKAYRTWFEAEYASGAFETLLPAKYQKKATKKATSEAMKKLGEKRDGKTTARAIEADFPDKPKKRTPRKLHRKTPGLYAEELTDGWTVVDPEGGRWWPNEKARQAIQRSKNPAATALRIADGIDDRDYLRGLGGDFVD